MRRAFFAALALVFIAAIIAVAFSGGDSCPENADTRFTSTVQGIDFNGVKIKGKTPTPEQKYVISEIIGQGFADPDLSVRDVTMGLMTGGQESKFRNLKWGDHCSLGVFQQQWCIGDYWGTKAQVTNVPYATKRFYKELKSVKTRDTMSIFDVIVYHVQRPKPAAYRSSDNSFMSWQPLAEELIRRATGQSTSSESQIQSCNASSTAGIVPAGSWTLPLNKPYTISSPFSLARRHPITGEVKIHDGTDFAGRPLGTPIVAASNGEVIHAGPADGYGNYVVIRHNVNGRTVDTGYAHLNSIGVSVGQTVQGGQEIGKLGKTGYATGAHLHFNVKDNGNWVDPMIWLDGLGLNP